MKQIKVILAVAVATILISCNSNKPESKESTTQDNNSLAKAGSIVYVQIDSLVHQYDMFNDLKSGLEAKAQVIQDDLNKKGRAFESAAKDFETKVNKGLLTRAQMEQQQQQLLEKQQSLQGLSQQKQAEMAEEEGVVYRQVMDAIKTYLKMYNIKHGYSLILTTSGSTNNVIVGDPALDITNDVLAGLNEEYVKSKKK